MTYTTYAEPYPATRGDRWGATEGRASAHRGQDTAPGGLPFLSVAEGVFADNGQWSSILGNCARIEHADGMFSGYAHGASLAGVKRGQRVGLLGAFGLIGATGSAARGRHMHYTIGPTYESLFSGKTVDPLEYIAAHSAPASHNADGGMYTATETDGIPGAIFYSLVQRWAKDWGYSGPLDGKPGPATWSAVQRALRDYGYSGPIDGAPGPKTWAALQRWGRQGGYAGPDDGALGRESYKAIARTLNRAY